MSTGYASAAEMRRDVSTTGITQHYTITINNDGSNGQIGPQAMKSVLRLIERKTKQILATERRPGGSMG